MSDSGESRETSPYKQTCTEPTKQPGEWENMRRFVNALLAAAAPMEATPKRSQVRDVANLSAALVTRRSMRADRIWGHGNSPLSGSGSPIRMTQ